MFLESDMDILYIMFSEDSPEYANMLATCLQSFRKVNKDARIIIYSPNMSVGMNRWLSDNISDYQVVMFNPDEWYERRMLCKLEKLQEIAEEYDDSARILMADADLYFCHDPFIPFFNAVDDLAFCERTSFLRFPVNGGVVYLRNKIGIRDYIRWFLHQIADPIWHPFASLSTRRKWPDFFCDQDMLCAIYRNKQVFECMMRVKVTILAPDYNWFPEVDSEPNWKEMMKEAYLSKIYTTLHFKALDLKKLYKESWFIDYVEI